MSGQACGDSEIADRCLTKALQMTVETTMIYPHLLNRGGRGGHSPLDRLRKPMSVEKGELGRPAGRPNAAEAN